MLEVLLLVVFYLVIGHFVAEQSMWQWHTRSRRGRIARFLWFPLFTLSGMSINREPLVGRIVWESEHEPDPTRAERMLTFFVVGMALLWPLAVAWSIFWSTIVSSGVIALAVVWLVLICGAWLFDELPKKLRRRNSS